MLVSRYIQLELAAQFRELWASVPPPGTPAELLAWFQLRKAEFWDGVAGTNPAIFLYAREIATRARYQARAITGEDRAA